MRKLAQTTKEAGRYFGVGINSGINPLCEVPFRVSPHLTSGYDWVGVRVILLYFPQYQACQTCLKLERVKPGRDWNTHREKHKLLK